MSKKETPEYFLLRPEVEKSFGYSHAVKIGEDIRISGAVSMDDEGNPTAVGARELQMKTPPKILAMPMSFFTIPAAVLERRIRVFV